MSPLERPRRLCFRFEFKGGDGAAIGCKRGLTSIDVYMIASLVWLTPHPMADFGTQKPGHRIRLRARAMRRLCGASKCCKLNGDEQADRKTKREKDHRIAGFAEHSHCLLALTP